MTMWIQGMRRSGTTILYDALLEDPELHCFYEPLREDTETIGGGSGARDEDLGAETRALRERFRAARYPELQIELYEHAANHAAGRGIILADTKFEFGASPGAEIVLGDEVLTPDSSRFWPADEYEPGRSQHSFDKQYVRDWLDEEGWDHSPPPPKLPDDVIANTRAKYVEAYERISGRTLEGEATQLAA